MGSAFTKYILHCASMTGHFIVAFCKQTIFKNTKMKLNMEITRTCVHARMCGTYQTAQNSALEMKNKGNDVIKITTTVMQNMTCSKFIKSMYSSVM